MSYQDALARFDYGREFSHDPKQDDWEKKNDVSVKTAKFPKLLAWVVEEAMRRAQHELAATFTEATFYAVIEGEERYTEAVRIVDNIYSEILFNPVSILPKEPPPEDEEGLREWLKAFAIGKWWPEVLRLDVAEAPEKPIAAPTFKSWLAGNSMGKKSQAMIHARALCWYEVAQVMCELNKAAAARISLLCSGDSLERCYLPNVQTELKHLVDSGASEEAIRAEHRRLWNIAMTELHLFDYQNLQPTCGEKHTYAQDAIWEKYWENDRKLEHVVVPPEWVSEYESESFDTRMWPIAVGDNPVRYRWRRPVIVRDVVRVAKDGRLDVVRSRIVKYMTPRRHPEGSHRRMINGEEVTYNEVWEECFEYEDSYNKVWGPLELQITRMRHRGEPMLQQVTDPLSVW